MNFTPNLVHTPCDSNTAIARSSFPIDALPQPLHDYVIAASAAAQTSLDLAAVTCLGVCSAALAGHVRIADGAGDKQPASLFVATVTAGLRREADLFQWARQPLQTLEAEQIEAARIPRIKAQSLLRQAKIRLRQREKQAAGDHQQFRQAALDFATQVVENHVPALPRLLIDDTTTAKLSTILAEQDGRVARFSTETAASDLFSGSRSQRSLAQQALYWKGYRGEEVTIDHRGGERTTLRRTAISCVCSFAKSTVAGLRNGRARRSRGVLDAFLFALPEPAYGQTPSSPTAIPNEVRQQYETRIRSLAAQQTDFTLRLSDEARQRYQAWQTEIAMLIRSGNLPESLTAWADHLPGNTLRLAAILHTISNRNEAEISATTLQSAIAIAQYFLPHALAMFDLLQQPYETPHRDHPTSPPETSSSRPTASQIGAEHPGTRHIVSLTPISPANAAPKKRGTPCHNKPAPAIDRREDSDLSDSQPREPRPRGKHPPTTRGSGPRTYRGSPAAKRRAKR